MSTPNGQPLRFASLVRVSTEKQEQQGESLRTQRKGNKRDVERLGGVIVAEYGGQEHGTPGYEKAEVDRLIADAAKGPWDAVIVADADRWSRDNEKSTAGLEVFKQYRKRFFVGTTEYNLFRPDHEMYLGMSAVIGKFQAAQQNKKSIENRIERAKRGLPTSGRLPFGRTFDKETGKWDVDPEKKALIEDVAARYLAGESMMDLASEYRISHSQLCKILRLHSGDEWSFEFHHDGLDIHEPVTVRVPRLLDEKTIKAVRHHLAAKRTHLHGKPKYDYLLNGRIFCSVCGYNLTGQPNHQGVRYYRHAHRKAARECRLRPRPWVKADDIEQAVLSDLFDMFGNPAAIERAVKAAIPNCDKERKRQSRLEEDLAKIERARDSVLDLIELGNLTIEQADTKLAQLKEREAGLREQLGVLADMLANVPDAQTIQCYVENFGDAQNPCIVVYDEEGNTYAGGNDVQSFIHFMTGSGQDRRHLIESHFSTQLPDGRPAGVYITPAGGDPHGPKQFTYELLGQFAWRVMPRALHPLSKPHNALPFKVAGVLG